MRLRVRTWEAFVRWLQWRWGRAWPTSQADVVDFVMEKMRDRPEAYFPRSVLTALHWFESRSGLPLDSKIGKSETLKFIMEKTEQETPKQMEAVRRAPRFPLSLVAAMELAVSRNMELPAAARVVLWSRLVKIYGALRMDDL